MDLRFTWISSFDLIVRKWNVAHIFNHFRLSQQIFPRVKKEVCEISWVFHIHGHKCLVGQGSENYPWNPQPPQKPYQMCMYLSLEKFENTGQGQWNTLCSVLRDVCKLKGGWLLHGRHSFRRGTTQPLVNRLIFLAWLLHVTPRWKFTTKKNHDFHLLHDHLLRSGAKKVCPHHETLFGNLFVVSKQFGKNVSNLDRRARAVLYVIIAAAPINIATWTLEFPSGHA